METPNPFATTPTPLAPPISPPPVPVAPIPTPIPTPPVVASAPTPVQNPFPPTTTGNSPKRPKWLIPVAIALGLLFLAGVAFAAVNGKKIFSSLTSSNNEGEMLTVSPTIAPVSKYAQDTDSDFIPDAIEQEVGLDPMVSEFTRCEMNNACGSGDASSAQVEKKNILLIIDSSGSMGLKIGDKTKMDMAKEAIKNFLTYVKPNVNVGIMVYGNKGSNSSSDKAVSCASADMVASIGSVSSATVDGYLSQIKPVGWTPIGLAIKNGKNAFVGKEGQNNQIIVVTDGGETCNTDPVGAAAEAVNSIYKVKVDVIGFAISNEEQAALSAISSSGGGVFSVANNADELLNQAKASQENMEKFQVSAKCSIDAYQISIDCLTDTKTKAMNYLSTLKASAKGAEWSELATLETTISTPYNKKTYALQDELGAALKASKESLLN